MPSKHIPESTWRKVEKEMVKLVVELQEPIKDTQVLNWLILKGLETVEMEDYKKYIKNKKLKN